MTKGSEGVGINSVFSFYKPYFIWDPLNANVALGNGYQGGGRVDMTLTDIDATSITEQFSVWDASQERYVVITVDGYASKVLGSVGDFSDGVVENRWTSSWSTSRLGFTIVAPTGSEMLVQDSVPADIIIGGTMPNRTYVDTTEGTDTIIERSNVRSAAYRRVFQILVKNQNDAYLPTGGNVLMGINATANTRVTDGATWCRKLPGSRGWWAIMLSIPAGTGTQYLSLSFKSGTGRWYISAPMFYNIYSTFGNIVRAPIPCYAGPTHYSRGKWNCKTTTNEFSLGISGWLAMSIVIPDRSVSNGHLNYVGVANYAYACLFTWASFLYRIRVIMSNSNNHLAVQFDNEGTSFVFLDFGDDWVDFEKIGMVVTWGISNGTNYASLYINGKKIDSVTGAADWFIEDLGSSFIYIGSEGDAESSAAADCWIPRLAVGKQPMHRSQARVLSLKMRDFARCGNLGEMS